jgi:hypothetical protein
MVWSSCSNYGVLSSNFKANEEWLYGVEEGYFPVCNPRTNVPPNVEILVNATFWLQRDNSSSIRY